MVLHYKCPDCGADMAFDSESGKLSCPSCGRKDTIETFPTPGSAVFEENEVKEYHCGNCGATLITDADTTATTCSFCGAGIVLGDRLTGNQAPVQVIPFTISKERAMSAFRKWCKNGLLTPKGFMTADRVKSITGMYVPFWLYDVNGKATVNAEATKVRTYTKGDYIYTETSYYHVYRKVNLNYRRVPADASAKMNDELMDKLEPFYYNELKPFRTPYLAGFIAEKYNFSGDQIFARIRSRVTGYVNHYIRSTISGYSSVNYIDNNISIDEKQAVYTLLPVWMVCYDYNHSEHTFAMNGQTGKIVGTPPLSKGKIAAWFAGISGGGFLLFRLITLLLGGIL